MADPFSSVAVIGGGAWGTALASLAARNGVATLLWAREPEVVDSVNRDHENRRFLPGMALPDALRATMVLSEAGDADAFIFVVPAQFTRSVLTDLRTASSVSEKPLILCSKGIEIATGSLLTEVLAAVWPEAVPAVLSGPSFAADVARGLPTAVTLAAADRDQGARWTATVSAPTFRPYLSDDLVGAELGGAIKNVLAIACGICEGKGFGESARAALMARGFAEFQRLGMAMGARPETMGGLSGLGDLILTCSSRQSRNMSLGYEIGQGGNAAAILAARDTVSEGAASAEPLQALAARHGVDMPICKAVADIVADRVPADDAIMSLLQRPLRQEG